MASMDFPTSTLPLFCRQAAPGDRQREGDRGPPGKRRQHVRRERRQERSTALWASRPWTDSAWEPGRARSTPEPFSTFFRTLASRLKEVETILYKKSGLLGISGISNDMRVLVASEEPRARLAVDYFVYQATKEIGALAAVLGGIDGLVFTAGIGENSAEIRQRICEASAWLGIELDGAANISTGAADLGRGQQSVGLGDSDQRRTDDCQAYQFAAWPQSCDAPAAFEVA